MRIEQRNSSDCGICCIAMALALPYEEVLAAAHDCWSVENGLKSESKVLERLGLNGSFFNGHPCGDFVCFHSDILSPHFFLNFAYGRRALMTVPSLNHEGLWHMVYWDGTDVHDPSRFKKYVLFCDLKPREMVLFRESPQ
jgi:hypothetical protein